MTNQLNPLLFQFKEEQSLPTAWAVNEVYKETQEVRLVYLVNTKELAEQIVEQFTNQLEAFEQRYHAISGIFYDVQEIVIYNNINDLPVLFTEE